MPRFFSSLGSLGLQIRKASWQGGLNVWKSTMLRYKIGGDVCIVMHLAYPEDRARKIADIVSESKSRIKMNKFKLSL